MFTRQILQLTDTHLFESSEKRMFGVDTNAKFFQILEFIKNNNIGFDCIFLTGDLSQDETTTSYEIIADSLCKFGKDIYWIAGNHDDPFKMKKVFGKHSLFKCANYLYFEKINWHLDTVFPGKNSGYIANQELEKFSYENFFI